MTWTHDALAEDLASHFRAGTDRMVWTDIPMGPVGSVRPDVLTLPKSYATNALIYEVKVSVSDFRADVTAGKWHSYLRFAAGVYFAVPAGLIGLKDVPQGAGLYVRNDAGWKALKKPTLQPQPSFDSDVWMKLLMDGTKREVERAEAAFRPRAFSAWRADQQTRKLHGQRVAEAVANIDSFERRLAGLRERFERESAEIEQRRRRNYDEEQQRHSQMRAELDSWVNDLGQQLGLELPTSVYTVRAELSERLHRLDANHEIRHLRSQLDSIRKALIATSIDLHEASNDQ